MQRGALGQSGARRLGRTEPGLRENPLKKTGCHTQVISGINPAHLRRCILLWAVSYPSKLYRTVGTRKACSASQASVTSHTQSLCP